MGFMFTNRTHAAGCSIETEIIGTHGTRALKRRRKEPAEYR